MSNRAARRLGAVIVPAVALLFASGALAQAKKPRAVFQETAHNFGKVKQGELAPRQPPLHAFDQQAITQQAGKDPLPALRARGFVGVGQAFDQRAQPGGRGRARRRRRSGRRHRSCARSRGRSRRVGPPPTGRAWRRLPDPAAGLAVTSGGAASTTEGFTSWLMIATVRQARQTPTLIRMSRIRRATSPVQSCRFCQGWAQLRPSVQSPLFWAWRNWLSRRSMRPRSSSSSR